MKNLLFNPAHVLFGCLALLPLATSATAHAQSTKVFVASIGNDANDGSRGAPKRNFQAAHNAVADNGQIVALDTAGYGALTITKSVDVTVPPGVSGFVSVPASATAITVSAPPTARVALRGLSLNGPSPNGSFSFGIEVTSVGTLTVLDCTLSGFGGRGIGFTPTGAATLLVKNSTVRNCFNGILVPTNTPANATVILDGCLVEDNVASGLDVTESLVGGASHRATVCNSIFAGNGSGIVLFGASNRLTAQGCTFSANKTGVAAAASGTTVRLDGCIVAGNASGLIRAIGANLLSRGNNTVEDNVTTGSFTGTYLQQ